MSACGITTTTLTGHLVANSLGRDRHQVQTACTVSSVSVLKRAHNTVNIK